MSRKVILVAGTPAEHSINYSYKDNKRDFASKTYNYAVAILKANRGIKGRNSFDVEIVDYPVTRKMDNLSEGQIAEILNKSPVAIGFSAYCWNRHIFENTARSVKRENKGVKIFLGGPSVSYNPVDILKNNKDIDIIVVGDGEETFSELLNHNFKDLDKVRGIVFRCGDSIIRNPKNNNVDINNLLSPYLSDNYLPNSDAIMIEPSRGCIYRCKFCSWSKDRKLNIKNKSMLINELLWSYERGYRKINFSDTSINMTNEQLSIISDSLRLSNVYEKLSLSVFMKYDRIDETQIKMIDGLRFDEIIIGLESINDAVLKECGKPPFSREKFERIIKVLGEMGNKITISIITGLPKDSYKGIEKTIKYLEELINKYPDYINFVCSFWLAILPGTRFEREAEKYGFKYLQKGTPYLVSSKYMSAKELLRVADFVYRETEKNVKFFCEEYYIELLEGK
ncbi:MAG: B12-binding domain-containing radical SAM protein [Deltaproteobacteria bacterium]|nr:B12-binding domain-containing radical SAM protein [Deltaproteobacteria bacterium]